MSYAEQQKMGEQLASASRFFKRPTPRQCGAHQAWHALFRVGLLLRWGPRDNGWPGIQGDMGFRRFKVKTT